MGVLLKVEVEVGCGAMMFRELFAFFLFVSLASLSLAAPAPKKGPGVLRLAFAGYAKKVNQVNTILSSQDKIINRIDHYVKKVKGFNVQETLKKYAAQANTGINANIPDNWDQKLVNLIGNSDEVAKKMKGHFDKIGPILGDL